MNVNTSNFNFELEYTSLYLFHEVNETSQEESVNEPSYDYIPSIVEAVNVLLCMLIVK